MIARTPVTSKSIQGIGYDPETRTLAVHFSSGALYHYADVPPEVHAELTGAKSIGQHFHAKVRTAGFSAERQQIEKAGEQ